MSVVIGAVEWGGNDIFPAQGTPRYPQPAENLWTKRTPRIQSLNPLWREASLPHACPRETQQENKSFPQVLRTPFQLMDQRGDLLVELAPQFHLILNFLNGGDTG